MWGAEAWGEAPWGALVDDGVAGPSVVVTMVVGHLVGQVEAYALEGEVASASVTGRQPTTVLPSMRVGG